MKRLNNDYDINCEGGEVIFYDENGNIERKVKINHLVRLYVEFMND